MTVEKIPAVIWGIFIGILPAWLNNRWNNYRFKQQLGHDVALRKIERDAAMRRDIYLAAADAIGTGIVTISRLADPETPAMVALKEWLEKAPSLAKIQVVASTETLRAFLDLENDLAGAMARIAAQRVPLEILRINVAAEEKTATKSEQDFDDAVRKLREIRSGGGRGSPALDVAEEARNAASRASQLSIASVAGIRQKMLGLVVEHGTNCTREIATIRLAAIPLIVRMRAELDIDHDAAAMEVEMERTNHERLTAFDATLVEMRKHLPPSP